MLEFLLFIGSIVLIFSIGYTIKLLTSKQEHLSDIDCGRILDINGKPVRQTTPVINI